MNIYFIANEKLTSFIDIYDEFKDRCELILSTKTATVYTRVLECLSVWYSPIIINQNHSASPPSAFKEYPGQTKQIQELDMFIYVQDVVHQTLKRAQLPIAKIRDFSLPPFSSVGGIPDGSFVVGFFELLYSGILYSKEKNAYKAHNIKTLLEWNDYRKS